MQIRIHTISLALAACLPLSASLSLAADTDSVASRLAAQNALFEEQYQADLKASPLTATSYGDYRYNDQLDDASMAEAEREHATDEKFLARLNAISTDWFPGAGSFSPTNFLFAPWSNATRTTPSRTSRCRSRR